MTNSFEVKCYETTQPQKSIILTDNFYSNKHISIISGWCYINDHVDFEKLELSINKLVENNDAYRLVFTKDDNEILQYFTEYSPFKLKKIFVKTPEDLEENLKNISFDIFSEPPVKFLLFEDASGKGGFTCSAHHSISDAWSMTLMLEDVLKCYYELINNEEISNLHSSSYVNFINSSHDYFVSTKYEKDKAYWESIFSTPIEHIDIRKKDDPFDTLCNRLSFSVPKKIHEYCQNEKVSPFSLFFASLSIYLSRIYSTNEITLGTPILNRTNFLEKNTAGMFVSTLPFRLSIDENISAKNLIQKISINQMGLLRHQKYPYSKLQEFYAQKFGRQNNLYDILFSYQNARTQNNEFNLDYKTKWIFTNHQAEALVMNVSDIDNTGNLNIDYDFLVSAFTNEDITDMHYRILAILDQIISNSDVLVKDIDIVTEDEKHNLINTFNQTECDFETNTTISRLFEKAVENHKDDVALVYDNKELTYSELNLKANSLANNLKAFGIKNGDIVGLMFYRSFEMIISQLAVLKLGAAYLPIDPAYPKERIDYMISDSKCHFLLKDASINFENSNVVTKDVLIDSLDNFYEFENESTPSNLAYIIYTSGSTGKPKGVMIKNQNIINTLQWRKNLYNFNNEITVLQIPSFSFDSSVEDIFTPLISGSKLVLLKQNNTNFNIPLMKELISKYNVNNMLVVPSFYNVLLNELSDKLTNFKHIIVAGEGFSSELVEKHYRLLPNVELYNEYGPTENSVCSTYYKFDGHDSTVSIGKPISNCKCYVLNEHLKLQPYNIRGELYVSGPGVSTGYIGREDLNKARFIKNPFCPDYPMYKTGDIVKINKNGNMVFCERADYQVKYNGYRINLGEIEVAISSYVKVPNVIALIRNTNEHHVLTAFIETNEKFNTQEIKRNLKKFLPHYMIPKEIILLEKFLSTPNGKIDRKALENYVSTTLETVSITPPRDELDKEILNVWKEVLNKNDIGIDDNIFDIGGDSLSIISIQSILFKKNIKVRSQDLFENQTVHALADTIKCGNGKILSNEEISERIYKDDEKDIKPLFFSPKNVLLTGATGFLGAHILAELVSKFPEVKIYCIVRSKPNKPYDKRLKEILYYYFGNKYDLLFGKNILPIEGDLTRDFFGLNATLYKELVSKIDTIINCASLVKHFGAYDSFYNSNVLTVKNLIDFSKESNATLNHISTTSVSGNFLVKNDITFDYTENDFYIGQNYKDNVYVQTKFEAENLIYKEQKNGLNANVFRLGNIMPRLSDGKFQINKMDNAYYKRVLGFLKLKILPNNLKGLQLEFTPVDFCAKAIVKLLPYNNKVFHILNPNTIDISKLFEAAKKQHMNVEFVSENDFNEYIHNLKDDSILDSFVTDLDDKNELNYDTKITINNNLTNKYLKILDFKWPTITEEYLEKFLKI